MKFSILIPAYKNQYLQECINSILAQTFENWELIILNDASPYDVDGIVATFSDPRIRYYKNEVNVGATDVVDNWNKCLKLAEGDYIVCMGDDDRLLPSCLEEYVNLIDKYPGLGVYHAWTEIIDENGKFNRMTSGRCEFESVYSLIWHRWSGMRYQYIGDFLFDTKMLREKGGFYKLPLAWASDDITAVMCAAFKGIANTQVVTFQYRQNSQTISNTGNAKLKMEALCQEREWYLEFLSSEPTDELDRRFYDDIMRIMPNYFNNKTVVTISGDLNLSIFNIFYWIKKRRHYGYGKRVIVKSLIRKVKSVMMV